MKRLIIFIFLIALLMSNVFLSTKTNSKDKCQISIKFIQAMADENPEEDEPDPGNPIPFRVFPQPGLPDYIIYRQ